MTDVMVHSLVDKNFSFAGSKFNHIQTSDGAEMSIVRSNGIEENFDAQMKTASDKCSEISECESDIDDSMLGDAHRCEVNITKLADNSPNHVVKTKSDISNEDYKILTTKTTVINTTYNLIAQSTAREIMNMTTGVECSPWSSFPNVMTEAVDKSRVIVQVLKSDLKSKSQSTIDNKSANSENQSAHSFRDDLCKLLSKSRSSKVDEGKNRELYPGNDMLHVSDTFQDASSESQDSKTHIVKARRKRNLNIYFWNGRGKKIGDLKCVWDNLRQANPASLRYLHYVMFNSLGLCGTGLQLLETKKNISGFCGYPFKRSSEQFQKKLKCIRKIPAQMLVGIHRAIFGKTTVSNLSVMANQLVDFLWIPRKCSEILKKYEDKIKYMSEDEYAALKESALRGPVLSVIVPKLPENDIRRYTNSYVNKKFKGPASLSAVKTESIEMESDSSYTIPGFILNGPGKKLKDFPKISNNVQTVREKPIKILHYILYGRIEPNVKDCRKNILEFNGFSECQQEFAAERKDIVKKLNQKELFELCQILCLRAKTNSREMRIRKILDYLRSPSKPAINRTYNASRWAVPKSSRTDRLKGCFSKRSSYKNMCKRKSRPSVYKSSESNFIVSNPNMCERKSCPPVFKSSESNFIGSNPSIKSSSMYSDCSDEVSSDDSWKLRDFRMICSNIECAAPSDLIELNDLLFLKTCDESDIHQKILDFTGFNFPVNSFHYDSRKTLMHYMGSCVVRKIARLLDIENWDKMTNPDDLSSNILKFLMKKADTDLPCSKSSTLPSSKDSPCSKSSTLPASSVVENSNVVESSTPLSSKSVLESCSVVESSSPLPSKSVLEHCSVVGSSSPLSSKSVLESCSVVESLPPLSPKSVLESCSIVRSSPTSVLEKCSVINPETSRNFTSEIYQQTNQAVSHQKGKVIIQRLTKASVQTQEMRHSIESGDNETVQINGEVSLKPDFLCINSAEDDSTRLRDLIHHPSEQELKDLVYHIVKENLWSFTLGDLVQRVYKFYPKVNLSYRESFIKATARQMLSELRDYAVSAVKEQAF